MTCNDARTLHRWGWTFGARRPFARGAAFAVVWAAFLFACASAPASAQFVSFQPNLSAGSGKMYLKRNAALASQRLLYWFAARSETNSEASVLGTGDEHGRITIDVPPHFNLTETQVEILDQHDGTLARLPLRTDGSITTITKKSFAFAKSVSVRIKDPSGRAVADVLVTLQYDDKYWGPVYQQVWLQDAYDGEAEFTNIPLNVQVKTTVRFKDKSIVSESDVTKRDSSYVLEQIEVPWPDVKVAKNPGGTGIKVTSNAGGVRLSSGGRPTAEQFREATSKSNPMAPIIVAVAGVVLVALGLFWLVDSGRINPFLGKLGIQVASPVAATAGAPSVRMAPTPAMRPSPRPVPDEAASPLVTGGGGGSPGAGPRLVATLGPYAGSIFPLAEASVLIGRDVANNVALTQDNAASRKHAHIDTSNGQYILEDDGSSNGTYVNGVRIASKKPQPLRPGDEVQIGTTRFRFEA